MADAAADWCRRLAHIAVPVLPRSRSAISGFREYEDNVTPREVAGSVLLDPFMTLRVLQYLQAHRRASQTHDITTIDRALMMFGMRRFFAHFTDLPDVEARLVQFPEALDGLRRVLSRARHAALYARDWAIARHDVDTDEIVVAALLHDLAEMLLWCAAPQLMLEIATRLRADPTLRSADAQVAHLGCRVLDVQLMLLREWDLPSLLHDLIDDREASRPRVINVSLAVALARHSARGWDDAALPDDLMAIQRLLHISMEQVHARVNRVAVRAARDWEWYGVRPSAYWLVAARNAKQALRQAA
jgi:HD-like signal output (HDOD) protein